MSTPTSGRGDADALRVTRRGLFGVGLATAGAAAAGVVAGRATTADTASGVQLEPFHGSHQSGIVTPAQSHAVFLSVDIARPDRGVLRELLTGWTATATALTTGAPPPEQPGTPPGFSAHTDFATGLAPARLTVTFGLGPAVFDERFGLGAQRPRYLGPLPGFAGDNLNPAWCDGDVLVQICADDAQIVSHTFRALRARMPGLARMRWTQHGFLSRPADGSTPRNMFGHRDGTANPHPEAEVDRTVWVRSAYEPAWFQSGSYLVFRKIRMKTAEWDQLPLPEQNRIIGRRRSDGAPLSGTTEFDPVDLEHRDKDGEFSIPTGAHIRVVHGVPMLRRGYNYDYGTLIANAGGPGTEPQSPHTHLPGTPEHTHGGHSRLDAGLLFAAYMNDPPGQFIKAQRALAAEDRLTPFIEHTGSAFFAVPPGATPNEPIAAALLR